MRVVAKLLILVLFFSACVGIPNFQRFDKGSTNINLKTLEDCYRFLTYTDERFPLVSAHRGGPTNGFPENALETFKNSYENQPVIIECDISITKDAKLVLMHDAKVDRTTTGKGFVKDLSLSELKRFRLKDPEGKETEFMIPTLEEALQWGKGKVIFTLDVKRGVSYESVIEVIRRNNAEACSVIITYSANQAAEVHRLAPDLMISASMNKPEDLHRLNDMGVPDTRLVAFVGVKEASVETYRFFHSHGIMCILGTVGNLDKRAISRGDQVYYDLVDHGADILSTDRHQEAGVQLEKYRKDQQLKSVYIY